MALIIDDDGARCTGGRFRAGHSGPRPLIWRKAGTAIRRIF
jgi:hypothetical protein